MHNFVSIYISSPNYILIIFVEHKFCSECKNFDKISVWVIKK